MVRWVYRVAALPLLAGIVSCSSPPPPPTVVNLTVSASPTVNPTASGQAAPIVVRVYQLGSTTPFETITGNGFPYAISLEQKGRPKGEVVTSDIDTHDVYAYKPGQYSPYATLNNGIMQPSGLLVTKP